MDEPQAPDSHLEAAWEDRVNGGIDVDPWWEPPDEEEDEEGGETGAADDA